jgi:ketosteroid isomerase-like protein
MPRRGARARQPFLPPRVALVLALAGAFGCAAMTAAGEGPEAERIRAARRASNDAIARHDLAALAATWVDDVQVTAGLGSAANGRAEVSSRIAAAFADPTFDRWVRTTESVEVATDGSRAAEVGTWEGRWHKADGTMVRTGRYLAHWVRLPEGWRIRAEVFVALACSGSAECGQG